MVWLNDQHQNFIPPPGTFGGSRCTCEECEKERQEKAPCKHCWHDTGKMLLSHPPQSEEVCCHCGLLRYMRQEFSISSIGHGKYFPDR